MRNEYLINATKDAIERAQPPDPMTLLRQLVREVAAETEDYDQGLRMLLARIDGQPGFRDELADRLIDERLRDMLRAEASEVRRAVVTNAQNYLPDSRLARITGDRAGGPYAFPLIGGVKLGDASLDQLVETRAFYARERDTVDRRVKFFDAVIAVMTRKKAKIVRKALSEDELNHLLNGEKL